MRYTLQGSNSQITWHDIEWFTSYAQALQALDDNMSARHKDFYYYRIKNPPFVKIVRILKRPFFALSRWFSYMQRPITAQELGDTKGYEEGESLDNYSTHVNKDTRFVVARMFPVIIRLFKSSGTYNKIILDSLDYMMEITTKKFRDYPEVKGISGANIGIPFNLVVIKICKIGDRVPEDLKGLTIRYKGYNFLHMINPKVTDHSLKKFRTETNCGSVRLEKPIYVSRFRWVEVTFTSRDGNIRRVRIEKPITGTVQHEIDHNNGVLITDREWKYTDEDVDY